MKRYLVFCCDCWYPSGGWRDFQHDFDSLEEAQNYVIGWLAEDNGTGYYMWHIVDSSEGKIVAEGMVNPE